MNFEAPEIGVAMSRLTKALFTLCFTALLPLMARTQQVCGQLGQLQACGLELQSSAFNVKLSGTYAEYRALLRNAEGTRPKTPSTDASLYPRFLGLTESLKTALRTTRIAPLKQSLKVVQRISPTLVMAAGFDAPAGDLPFCENDICKYRGRIFLHLRQASVASEFTPHWLRFDGLKSYSTVLGAPDTIPEFSEINITEYPNISSLQNALSSFRPSAGEQKQYLEPVLQRYRESLDGYYKRLFQLHVDHLKQRLDLVQQMAAPLIGLKVVMVEHNGPRPMRIPEPMVESLPRMLDASRSDILSLTQEIDEVLRSGDQNAKQSFLEYTQTWIHFSEAEDCSNSYPGHDVNAPQNGYGRTHLEGYLVTVFYQPWCALHSWTRLEIPRIGANGVPIVPSWWKQ